MPLPIFPLNTVLFPGSPLPLRVFEARYLRMLADRAATDPIFGIALIKSGDEVGGQPEFHQVGTTARLVSLDAQSPERVDIFVIGDQRIRMGQGDWQRGYAMSEVEYLNDQAYDATVAEPLLARALDSYGAYLRGVAHVVGRGFDTPPVGKDAGTASFDIASRLPLHTWEQQALLEDDNPVSRMQRLVLLLDREVALLYKGGMVGVPIPYPGSRFTLN